MKQRVVITGLGVVSPLGNDLNVFWDRLVSGQSGIGKIESFDTSRIATKFAGEVKEFDPEKYIDKKDARKMDRFTQFAVAAANMALSDAKLNVLEHTDPERVGTIVGTYFGGMRTWEDQMDIMWERGPKRISPYFIPMMIVNMAAGMVSIATGAKGPNSCVVTGCASGINSIGDSFRLIQRGEVDVMICGGTDAVITEPFVAGFSNLGVLSDDASRPFDANRNGMVLGEGAGIVILESLEHAQKRGARIYAEVVGYAMTSDAYDLAKPEPTGEAAAVCMSKALNDAGLQPQEIGYVNAYGVGTVDGDKREAKAMHAVFQEHAAQVPVSSTKSMMGHLLGASGAVETIISTLVLQNDTIPPTINVETPDTEGELNLVANEFRKQDVQAVMNNTFGIGGHNATLILKKYA